jgi:hypothetical protein
MMPNLWSFNSTLPMLTEVAIFLDFANSRINRILPVFPPDTRLIFS